MSKKSGKRQLTKEAVLATIGAGATTMTAVVKALGYKSVCGGTTKRIRELVPDVGERLKANAGGKSPTTAKNTGGKAAKATKPAKSKGGSKRGVPTEYPRAEHNPFRQGSAYGACYDILAHAGDKGMKRAKLVEELARVTGKPAGRKPVRRKRRKKVELATMGDLFCGIGGFRLAWQQLGLECRFSSDIDVAARETYRLNFGEHPSGDITKVASSDVPQFDVLCGGFPCQAWSNSATDGGKGFDDPRGKLIFEVFRIVEAVKPKVLFLENVPAIAGEKHAKEFEEICRRIHELGYSVAWREINASLHGCATARRRIYIVCFDRDLGVGEDDFSFPEPTFEPVRLRDLLLPDSETRECVVDVVPTWECPPASPDVHGRYPLDCFRIGRVGKKKRFFDKNPGATEEDWKKYDAEQLRKWIERKKAEERAEAEARKLGASVDSVTGSESPVQCHPIALPKRQRRA